MNSRELFTIIAAVVEKQLYHFLTHCLGRIKGMQNFSDNICPKVNVKDQPEFELAYWDLIVQYVHQ